MNMPVITLEIQGMKHTVMHMISNHTAAIDKDVQDSIDRLITEDNIRQVINSAVKDALERAIKSSISDYFSYGDGRKAVDGAVKEAISAKLKSMESDG